MGRFGKPEWMQKTKDWWQRRRDLTTLARRDIIDFDVCLDLLNL